MRFGQTLNLHQQRPIAESPLAAPIQAEKDRAEAGGATIEDGVYTDLIQPIYEVLDAAGVWSDVRVFYVPGVRTVISGSQSKIWDQSGNKNDATQSTSSKRPTDGTDANFGGHTVSIIDGSDDELVGQANLGISGNPGLTLISVFELDSPSWGDGTDFKSPFGTTQSGTKSKGLSITHKKDTGKLAIDYWRTRVHMNNEAPAQTPLRFVGTHKSNGSISGSDVYLDGAAQSTSTDTGNAIDIIDAPPTIGDLGDGRYWIGPVACSIALEAELTSSQVSDVDSVLKKYY